MLSKTKCRLGANRETSLEKDDPLNFDSLFTASISEHLAMLNDKTK